VLYVFKCGKCHLTHCTDDFLKTPVCCGKAGSFLTTRGTEAMTESDFNLQAKQLVDSLTATNKELIEAMELVNSSAIALNLGGSNYKERKKNMKQWLGMKEKPNAK